MNTETIGDRIAKKRKELGLTQNKLAEMLIISNKAVSKWESGLSSPSIDLLPKLSDILCCTTDYLLKGEYGLIKHEKVDFVVHDIDNLFSRGYFGIAVLQNIFNIGYAKAAYLMEKLICFDLVKSVSNGHYVIIDGKQEIVKRVIIKHILDTDDLEHHDNSDDELDELRFNMLQEIKKNVSEFVYDVWINSLEFVGFSNNILYLITPSESSKSVIMTKYLKEIYVAAHKFMPNIEDVKISVRNN